MEAEKILGIYLSKDKADVVSVSVDGRKVSLDASFVAADEQQDDENVFQHLSNRIAQLCNEKNITFSQVAVSIDCSMFMQHTIHSDFKDLRQIKQTIRFDAEEVLATDVSELAIAFRVISSDENGSKLLVFTAQRKMLSDILKSLQSNNIDPVTVEPDITSLSRFIDCNMELPEDKNTLVCILSERVAYFTIYSKSKELLVVRSFLIEPSQNREKLLNKEIALSKALVEMSEPVGAVKVFDSSGLLEPGWSGGKSAAIESVDLAASVATEPEAGSVSGNIVEQCIAFGSARALLARQETVNFRSDFSPYMGKKMRVRKAIKVLTVSLSILLIALGIYMQIQIYKENKPGRLLRQKFAKDYSVVMSGDSLPGNFKRADDRLRREINRIRSLKRGEISAKGEIPISRKLTFILKAFNKCAKKTDLNIRTISITERSIRITGDTDDRSKTIQLRKAIESVNLKILQETLEDKAGRGEFIITISGESKI